MAGTGEPTVTMSVRRHAEQMSELEDLRDKLSIYEREHDTVTLEEVRAELGLDVPDSSTPYDVAPWTKPTN